MSDISSNTSNSSHHTPRGHHNHSPMSTLSGGGGGSHHHNTSGGGGVEGGRGSSHHTNNNNTQSIADYLAQLLKDKKQLTAFPNVFLHVERILDDEITKVRANLFQINGKKNEPLVLPDASGSTIALSEKVYVPIREFPEFNFVGRILGPRGMTTKQLEQETGCKIMVRGKGSMRDKKKEDQNRGKPNWEHLNDELHVLITVEDTEARAKMKIQRAIDEVKKLLTVSEGEDELKKRQLMELAIINGTYRDSTTKGAPGQLDQARFLATSSANNLQTLVNQQQAALRAAAVTGSPLGGAPLILSTASLPRGAVPTTLAAASMLNGSPAAQATAQPQIITADTQNLLYAQYAAAVAAAGGAPEYAGQAAAYSGLVSPALLTAADYTQMTAQDPTGAAQRQLLEAQAAAAAAFSAGSAGAGVTTAVSSANGSAIGPTAMKRPRMSMQ